MSKYFFKSTVIHLYHNHKTEQHNLRRDLYYKFKNYTKQNWLDHLEKKGNKWGEPVKDSTIWKYIDTTGVKDFYNKEILLSMMKSKTPIITICMVSYKRYDTLIKTLERYISFNVSINFMIWLNTYTDYTKSQLQNIKNICEKLYSCDITYCKKNMGTGHPRNIMLSRAYREYDTPYIMTTDDDILYNSKEELFIGASILEQKKYYRYGAIGIWGEPNYWASYAVDNELRNYKPKKGFQTVNALNATTMTIKKEILNKCNVDPNYQIDLVDTDFSFQIRKNDYHLGLLCDDRWKPTNITDMTDMTNETYKKERFEPDTIKESTDRFIKKWNILPKCKKNTSNQYINTDKLNILWCKIDTSTRVEGHFDHIIHELEKKCNVTILTRDLKGVHPATFQTMVINKKIILDSIITNTEQYDCIILAHPFAFNEDWNKINIPIFTLLEDQHDKARFQVKMSIKYNFNVLHRYKLKPFNDDLNIQIKNHKWFPHAVNDNIFKDYGLSKQYDLLQIGAIYPIYKIRNLVKKYFDINPYKGYKYIIRPKETDKVKWPIGVDYAKELNKAWFVLCCGADVKYPVMKYFEIPLCGSIVYGDYFEELGELGFIPDKNMIVIDKNNIKGQLDHLLLNKDNLKEIIYNGKELIKSRHTLKTRVNDLINIINKKLNNGN